MTSTRTSPVFVSISGQAAVLVTSFGYLHDTAPPADVLVDVRAHLRDPHITPGLRALTGLDVAVIERVLATPGASELVTALAAAAAALLPAACQQGRLVRIAIGCAGGRHRSVVIANEVAARLALTGWCAETEHRHLTRPVVHR